MSYLHGALQNKHVLITGVGGFIGRRLALRLATEEKAIVTGIDRELDQANHLAQAGVQLVQADVRDSSQTTSHFAGKEIVFHLAAQLGRFGGSAALAYDLNVTMTEQVIRQAAAAGISRLVFISSISAYGFPSKPIMDEDTPLDCEQAELYGRTKAIAETRVMALAQTVGIEPAIIRTSMVYGPESDQWTLAMIDLIQKGLPVIFGDGSGHAYPAYIDNVVDGLLLTAVHPAAAGEAFNICDPVITLREFFTYYGDMCGRQPRQIPLWSANIIILINKLLRLKLPINRGRIKQYSLQVVYPTTKAETLLGYQIRVPVPEGMQRTETWLREEGIIA